MLRCDICLTDNHPQRVNPVDGGMSEVNLPRVIQPVVQCFIDPVDLIVVLSDRPVPETNHVQRDRSKNLEIIFAYYKFREPLGYPYMSSHLVAKPFNTIHPHYAPELEGPEPSAQWNSPVAVIIHLTLVLVRRYSGSISNVLIR